MKIQLTIVNIRISTSELNYIDLCCKIGRKTGHGGRVNCILCSIADVLMIDYVIHFENQSLGFIAYP